MRKYLPNVDISVKLYLQVEVFNWYKACHSVFVILRLQEDPPVGVSGAPSENNIMQWNAVIFG